MKPEDSRWKVVSAERPVTFPFPKVAHEWLRGVDSPSFGNHYDTSPYSWAGLALFKKALEGGPPVRQASWEGNLGAPAAKLMEAIESALGVRPVSIRGGDNGNGSCVYSSDDTMISVSIMEAGRFIQVSIVTTNEEVVQKSTSLFNRVIVPDNPESGLVFSLTKNPMGGYQIRRLGAAGTKIERGNYNPKVLADYDHVITDLASPSPCGRLTIMSGSPGTGKCVAKGTLIMDATLGHLLPVEAVVERHSQVMTFDFKRGVVPVTPAAWVKTGIKTCLRIETKAGHVLEATPEHPLLTPDGWRRLDEIQPDGYIAAAASIPFPQERAVISDDDVVLLSALMAEGNYTHNHVGFTNADPEIVARVSQALKPIGAELRQYPGQKSFEWRVISPKTPENGRLSVIRHFLDKHGMGHKKAPEKTVPEVVFRLGPEQLALFLGMLWSCDGSIEKKQGDITLGMASKVLVEQVQHLLLRLGIKSSIRSKTSHFKGKQFHSWALRVIATSRKAFAETIPLFGEKAERIKGLKFYNNPNDDLIPLTEKVRRRLLEALDTYQESGKKMGDIGREVWGTKYPLHHVAHRDHISKTVLEATVNATGAEDLRWLLKVRWEKVISVEAVGEKEVYDLSVPSTHNFLANDLVAHNTYLVRSMLSAVKQAAFVVVPPHLIPELGSPEILPALTGAKSEFDGPIVLILEDADRVLVDRSQGDMSAISSMLNLGDGILGAVLDIRILATTNAEQLQMDPATRRRGRLCRYIQVDPLAPPVAQAAFQRLTGKQKMYGEPTSVADVYGDARDAGWVAPPIATFRPAEKPYVL